MLAVQGTFDGHVAVPKEKIPFQDTREVIITFLGADTGRQDNDMSIKDRLALIESLFGTLPSTITDAEIKEARLERYEHTA